MAFFTDYYWMHRCMCIYIFPNRNLHVWFQGWPFDWTTTWCALPWERPPLWPSCPQLSVVLWGRSLVGFAPSSIDVDLVPCTFELTCWGDFAGAISDVARRWALTANSLIPDPLALLLSVRLLQCSLSLRCWRHVVHVSIETGLLEDAFWLVVIYCNGP